MFKFDELSHQKSRNTFAFMKIEFWCFDTCANVSFFMIIVFDLVFIHFFAKNNNNDINIWRWYRYQFIFFLSSRTILSWILFHFHTDFLFDLFRKSSRCIDTLNFHVRLIIDFNVSLYFFKKIVIFFFSTDVSSFQM